MHQTFHLPAGVTLLERGWLSSNNVLICGTDHCALIDSGYATHASQTLALLEAELQGRSLDVLLNTHLHSDHCGGNAALQQRYPAMQTLIPPGQARHVSPWNPHALSYTPTGQQCPAFSYTGTLQANSEIRLGDALWQVHAAPGHDPDSVILFEPQSRLMLSADALWENGFGVVFPELDGDQAFDDVATTLDLIETLAPRLVIPGHGGAFSDVSAAIGRARRRLAGFVQSPERHIRYAAKVLIKFKLLEAQRIEWLDLLAWAKTTELLLHIHQDQANTLDLADWLTQLVDELVHSKAALRNGQAVQNT
jgi:glyoxylase-like metal-dependent hydrolase (beta-lactamase superfamily II)